MVAILSNQREIILDARAAVGATSIDPDEQAIGYHFTHMMTADNGSGSRFDLPECPAMPAICSSKRNVCRQGRVFRYHNIVHRDAAIDAALKKRHAD